MHTYVGWNFVDKNCCQMGWPVIVVVASKIGNWHGIIVDHWPVVGRLAEIGICHFSHYLFNTLDSSWSRRWEKGGQI